jgi:hypothetical protein
VGHRAEHGVTAWLCSAKTALASDIAFLGRPNIDLIQELRISAHAVCIPEWGYFEGCCVVGVVAGFRFSQPEASVNLYCDDSDAAR